MVNFEIVRQFKIIVLSLVLILILIYYVRFILESYSVVEVETESSEDENELELTNHDRARINSVSFQETLKARNDSIDSQSKVSSSGSLHGISKCVMCGKEFQHSANLRIHLQSHLGARAPLKSCEKCDR